MSREGNGEMSRNGRSRYIVNRLDVPGGWDVDRFDWSMGDSEIARVLGVSRQMVWKARRAAHAPPAARRSRKAGGAVERVLAIPREQVAKMTAKAVARRIGSSESWAASVMKGLGLSWVRPPARLSSRLPGAGARRLWSKSNADIARRYGVTPGYVAVYRWRHGIPALRRALA